jgi:hypothetical protein
MVRREVTRRTVSHQQRLAALRPTGKECVDGIY